MAVLSIEPWAALRSRKKSLPKATGRKRLFFEQSPEEAHPNFGWLNRRNAGPTEKVKNLCPNLGRAFASYGSKLRRFAVGQILPSRGGLRLDNVWRNPQMMEMRKELFFDGG